MVDRIAKRYGVLPHEILELSPERLTVAMVCMMAGTAATAQACERAKIVFPTVSLGD